MKTLYIDCAMGCAGDMLTAALSAKPDSKCGIMGTHVTVLIGGDEEDKTECHYLKHTSVAEIMDFIDDVPLSDEVRTNAKAVYSLIAEAESTVHGKPIENIHRRARICMQQILTYPQHQDSANPVRLCTRKNR